ncbi:MAG TPA: serine hydrolase [Saprospiraceae bacterium]|nr:serine hydrolase [Saprospiraceae bacterium]
MNKHLLILIFFIPFLHLKSQSLYFPPITGNTWDTISPSSLGWCTDQVGPLLDYLESNHTKAFILLKDGKIVIEKYFGSFTQDSVWYWASAGKTLTSFMVGIAQQEGHLSINDLTSQYLGQGWTDCITEQEDKITIRHQLTMTSGLHDGVPDNYCTLDTCLICLADAGSRWAYHNAPYTLLDEVIQNATGVTLNNYINQKLKIPTGITGAFFPSGYNNVFFSKARSMARFGLLILNHGNWNGNQVMTDTSYFNQMVNTSQSLNLSYGYLWWLNGKASFRLPTLQLVLPGPLNPHAPDDMIAALGKNGQIINVVPGQNLVYIRMGDAPGAGEVGVAFNDTIWQKLNEVICDVSAVTDMNDMVGLKIYPNPACQYFTIDLEEGYYDILIANAMGENVYEQTHVNGSVEIDRKEFPVGVYFVTVGTAGKYIVRKLIIQ